MKPWHFRSDPAPWLISLGEEAGLGWVVKLGLSIVKQFVELQGGTIAVQSQVNGGTVFTVRLPLTAPTPPSPQEG